MLLRICCLLACILLLCQGSSHAMPRKGLGSPVRLTMNRAGSLIVSDYNRQAVFILNGRNGTPHRSFRIDGRPLAVGVLRGHIIVGNETTGSVGVYNPAGRLLYWLGESRGAVRVPTDLEVDEKRERIFVVDGGEKEVKVFAPDGRLLYTIGGPGTAPLNLANPTGIALDREREEVLVSDFGDTRAGIPPRIRIFDYAGNHLGTIAGAKKKGMRGTSFTFSKPQGLAVDGQGHIFLTDSLLGQVLVLDRATGALLKTVGSFGTAPGQLQLPLDVVLDGMLRDLYVTSNRGGRVEIFRSGGVIP